MEGQLLLRFFFAAVYGGIIAWVVFTRYDTEFGDEITPSDRQRYLPYLPVYLLPGVLTGWMIAALCIYGWREGLEQTFSFSFGILLQISLYDLVLLAVLPLLRRWISARACALLWMTPNYLYLTNIRIIELPMPRWAIPLSGAWLRPLVGLWFIGVWLVLLWSIVSHLLFRRRILKPAIEITDPGILAIWEQERTNACFRAARIRLMVSPAVVTPLSIGLIPRTTRVVLPHTAYDPEALALILRHELIHISRVDAMSKFFLLFCTALCWFNPLIWIARRKSAEDLELSCDETVLLQRDAQTRRRYAELLLTTAGDERGFTTCLSATAASLRYRLRQIISPRKKRTGALLAGLLFFLLSMSCGTVALAYGGGDGGTLLAEQGFAAEGLRSAKLYNGSHVTEAVCPDRDALADYLASLELRKLTGNYSFKVDEPEWTLLYETPDGTLAVVLGKSRLRIFPLRSASYAAWYYVLGGVDFQALSELLPPAPALEVVYTGSGTEARDISASVCAISEELDGQEFPHIFEALPPEASPSGVFGYDLDQVQLAFSRPVVSDITVEIQPLDGGAMETRTLGPEETVLALAPSPARYTVYADLEGNGGSVYHTIFCFDIGDV